MSNVKKFVKKRNSHKIKKHHKKTHKKTLKRFLGGSCGCGGTDPTKIMGGSCGACGKPFMGGKQSGGGYFPNPSFDKMPIHSFYSQNRLDTDVQRDQMSSRLEPQASITPVLMGWPPLIKGGSQKKQNKKYKKQNKSRKNKKNMSGGGVLMPSIVPPNSIPSNVVQNTNDIITPVTTIATANNIAGSLLGYNILRGTPMEYPNPNLINKNVLGKGELA